MKTHDNSSLGQRFFPRLRKNSNYKELNLATQSQAILQNKGNFKENSILLGYNLKAFLPAADETKILGIETETETRSLSGRDSRLRLRPESLRSRDRD